MRAWQAHTLTTEHGKYPAMRMLGIVPENTEKWFVQALHK